MNCGNFLNSTDAQSCGVEVGYGKLYLIYAEKQTVPVSSLNATAINAAIAAGTIVGVLKDWDEVAGAPVAEATVERPGSKKIRFISDEILADTITFDNSPCLNETLARLSRKGKAEVLYFDDKGTAYGEETYSSTTIGTMTVAFGNKTSTSFQSDNTNVNNLTITVRYLYKKLRAAAVNLDYDLIVSKYEVVLRDLTTAAGGVCTVKAFDNCSGSLATEIAAAELDVEVLVNGVPQTPMAVKATKGVIGFTLSATPAASSVVTIKVVSDDAFSQYVTFIIPT
jgi:uncharacterized protein YunC (DUF1805 family)